MTSYISEKGLKSLEARYKADAKAVITLAIGTSALFVIAFVALACLALLGLVR